MEQPELAAAVKARLQEHWSPEQIAGARKREFPEDSRQQISRQTIYTAIARDDHRLPLQKCLRRFRRGKPRRKRKGRTCAGIACRPAIIQERARFGDWEGDTIVSAGQGREALITLVERRSGLTELIPVPHRTSRTVLRAIHRRLKKYPPALRQSLTLDNGTEFSAWAWLQWHLGIQVYFANPHSPWQRGTNENTNGLVRQYFPKGTLFREVTRYQVRQTQDELNHRPRKRLDFQTPLEILQQQLQIALQT
jgi:IS30 family transposase